MPTITTVVLYSALTAIATGLGVVPLIFSKAIPIRLLSLASALASGLLLAAAFQLIGKGTTDNSTTTIVGIIVGLVSIS